MIQNLSTCQKKEWKKFLVDVSRAAISTFGAPGTGRIPPPPLPPPLYGISTLFCLFVFVHSASCSVFCILQD